VGENGDMCSLDLPRVVIKRERTSKRGNRSTQPIGSNWETINKTANINIKKTAVDSNVNGDSWQVAHQKQQKT